MTSLLIRLLLIALPFIDWEPTVQCGSVKSYLTLDAIFGWIKKPNFKRRHGYKWETSHRSTFFFLSFLLSSLTFLDSHSFSLIHSNTPMGSSLYHLLGLLFSAAGLVLMIFVNIGTTFTSSFLPNIYLAEASFGTISIRFGPYNACIINSGKTTCTQPTPAQGLGKW